MKLKKMKLVFLAFFGVFSFFLSFYQANARVLHYKLNCDSFHKWVEIKRKLIKVRSLKEFSILKKRGKVLRIDLSKTVFDLYWKGNLEPIAYDKRPGYYKNNLMNQVRSCFLSSSPSKKELTFLKAFQRTLYSYFYWNSLKKIENKYQNIGKSTLGRVILKMFFHLVKRGSIFKSSQKSNSLNSVRVPLFRLAKQSTCTADQKGGVYSGTKVIVLNTCAIPAFQWMASFLHVLVHAVDLEAQKSRFRFQVANGLKNLTGSMELNSRDEKKQKQLIKNWILLGMQTSLFSEIRAWYLGLFLYRPLVLRNNSLLKKLHLVRGVSWSDVLSKIRNSIRNKQVKNKKLLSNDFIFMRKIISIAATMGLLGGNSLNALAFALKEKMEKREKKREHGLKSTFVRSKVKTFLLDKKVHFKISLGSIECKKNNEVCIEFKRLLKKILNGFDEVMNEIDNHSLDIKKYLFRGQVGALIFLKDYLSLL